MALSRTQGLSIYPFVPWERLKPAIQWKQGQHVLTVGGTGSGKTTVSGELLPRRTQVVVCVSKGMDPIFDGPYFANYATIKNWPPPYKLPTDKPDKYQKVLLRPANKKTIVETRLHKKSIFSHMFDDILLHRGNWCIDVDETHYMCESLRLEREVTDILEQGRSAGISMWNNTQRPSGIPLATYVNSFHAFLFQSQERYDVERLGRMAPTSTTVKEMQYNLDRLDSFANHEFIYLDRSGRIPPIRSIVGSKSMTGVLNRGTRKR